MILPTCQIKWSCILIYKFSCFSKYCQCIPFLISDIIPTLKIYIFNLYKFRFVVKLIITMQSEKVNDTRNAKRLLTSLSKTAFKNFFSDRRLTPRYFKLHFCLRYCTFHCGILCRKFVFLHIRFICAFVLAHVLFTHALLIIMHLQTVLSNFQHTQCDIGTMV